MTENINLPLTGAVVNSSLKQSAFESIKTLTISAILSLFDNLSYNWIIHVIMSERWRYIVAHTIFFFSQKSEK